MKKNKMMRAASALLVAVLLTTCAVSGTFAKYVTEDSGEDYARVAKWGVEITPNGALFEKEYGRDDDTYGDSNSNTVVSSDEWKLVAPGTTKSLTEVQITGQPEVATRVTYDATVELTNWELEDSSEYCPLVFTVEGVDYYINKTVDQEILLDQKIDDIADLKSAVEYAVEACANDYAPNTDFEDTDVVDDFPSITWKWEFDGEKTGATLSGYQTDDKDTELGNLAVNRDTFVKITVKTTVTQID